MAQDSVAWPQRSALPLALAAGLSLRPALQGSPARRVPASGAEPSERAGGVACSLQRAVPFFVAVVSVPPPQRGGSGKLRLLHPYAEILLNLKDKLQVWRNGSCL